jgi:uncharacterized protein (TIGR04255 family)
MYQDVCYERSFLKDVIVRVDFSSPLDTLTKKIPPSVGSAVLARFPISEPKKVLAQKLKLSAEKISTGKQEFTEWNYYGREREKRLVIAPMSAFVTYSRYSTYEALKDDFFSVLSSLFEVFPNMGIGRTGLRYINHIVPPIPDPFEWHEYIDGRLLGLFSRFTDRQSVNRLFNIAEFKYEDLQIKFQFGAPNPDFPAAIRRALFILDIDGYVHGLQDLSEVSRNIDRAHERIQTLFEESVTDRLREVMHVCRA